MAGGVIQEPRAAAQSWGTPGKRGPTSLRNPAGFWKSQPRPTAVSELGHRSSLVNPHGLTPVSKPDGQHRIILCLLQAMGELAAPHHAARTPMRSVKPSGHRQMLGKWWTSRSSRQITKKNTPFARRFTACSLQSLGSHPEKRMRNGVNLTLPSVNRGLLLESFFFFAHSCHWFKMVFHLF